MWIPQWLLKSLHKVCIIITYTPWCGIRPAGCLAQGLVWAIEHCVRGARIPPTGRGKPAGVGFPIVKYRQSAPSRVLFDGKFHQAVAGWIEWWTFQDLYRYAFYPFTCCGGVDRSHTAVQCTKYGTRSGPFATMLSVCLSHAVLKRLNGSSCPFVWGLPTSIVTLLYYVGVLIPLKIGVRDTSPKFTKRALSQSHLAVYISGVV